MLGRAQWGRTLGMLVLVAVAALATVGAGSAWAGWLSPSDLAPVNPTNTDIGHPDARRRARRHRVCRVRADGSNSRIGLVVRTPGTSFSAVRDISDPGTNASSPSLAVDRQGNATVAWLGPTGVVQVRFRPVGGDWGAIQNLSAPNTNSIAAIATGDNGAAVVAWAHSLGGGNSQAEASVRPAGAAAFGSELPVSVSTGGLCQGPHVAMDAAGDVVALWTRRTPDPGARYLVESNVKAAGASTFAGAQLRSTEATGNSLCGSDVQMSPDGRATAMWDFSDGTNPTYVEYADRTGSPFAAGTWSASAKASAPADIASSPALAIDDSGNSTATWRVQNTFAGPAYVGSVRDGLGGFTAAISLGSQSVDHKAVAASPNGDAMVAFVGMSNGNDAIFSARRQRGTALSDVAPIIVPPPGGGTVFFFSVDIGLDDQGNAFAVWNHDAYDGNDHFTAQVAFYDPVPPTITAANVPATGKAGTAVAMSAAATDRMSGASVHFDFGDGSRADGASVSHIYAAPGTFAVKVIATDGAGNQSSLSKAITVAAPATTGGGGSSGTGTTGSSGGSSKLKRVSAALHLTTQKQADGSTRVNALYVDHLSGSVTVRLSCKGKGCRKGANRKIKARKHRTVSFTKYVAKLRLFPGAQLTVTVTRSGYVSRIFRLTMVAHKVPKVTTRCQAPGKKKTTAC